MKARMEASAIEKNIALLLLAHRSASIADCIAVFLFESLIYLLYVKLKLNLAKNIGTAKVSKFGTTIRLRTVINTRIHKKAS